MPIIKASQSAPLIKEAIVLDLGDLTRQGEKLRLAARQQADQILAAAREQANKMVESAHGQGFDRGIEEGRVKGIEEGRAQGRTEALAQASAQLEGVVKAWTAALESWESHRQEVELQARQAVIQLALKMGEKVVGRIVEVDPTVVADQLAEVVSYLLKPTDLQVRICPADRQVVENALPELISRFPRLQHVQLVDDAQQRPGGCVVSYGQGSIDASIGTQISRIVELLLPGSSTVHDASGEG